MAGFFFPVLGRYLRYQIIIGHVPNVLKFLRLYGPVVYYYISKILVKGKKTISHTDGDHELCLRLGPKDLRLMQEHAWDLNMMLLTQLLFLLFLLSSYSHTIISWILHSLAHDIFAENATKYQMPM